MINSYISHDEFFSVNNMLKEYVDMKEPIKSSKTSCLDNNSDKVKNVLISEKEFTDTNYKRLKKHWFI